MPGRGADSSGSSYAAEDKKGFVWDARGVDAKGRVIMQVYGMRMQKVSE